MNESRSTSLKGLDDASLIRRIRVGDAEATTNLFRRYVDAVYAYLHSRVEASPQLAEELTQETMVEAWTALGSFDDERPLWPWLKTIAGRKLARHQRGASASKRSPQGVSLGTEALALAVDDGVLPEDQILRGELRNSVAQALSAIAPRDGRLLIMKYVKQHSMVEIAERLAMSASAVNSALQRARAAFRKQLELVLQGDADHV